MGKKSVKPKNKSAEKERPVVVYMWAFGLALLGYLVVGEGVLEVSPYPIHWLAGLIGGLAGIPLGWSWYRWRGDVF